MFILVNVIWSFPTKLEYILNEMKLDEESIYSKILCACIDEDIIDLGGI